MALKSATRAAQVIGVALLMMGCIEGLVLDLNISAWWSDQTAVTLKTAHHWSSRFHHASAPVWHAQRFDYFKLHN